MVKVMEDDPRFQMGSYEGQKSPGLYMDGMLVELIKIFARNIVKDNQFLGLCSSSTFTVRTGKSTLLQQFATVYIDEINRTHGLNLTFTHKDIVFNTRDLEKRAFEKHNNGERYGALIMDESHGLDEHSFSKIMKRFQRFLKVSGQMNFLILLVVPDFFDCPKFLAMNRSNFLLNVKFENEFERGHFEYYNFTDKKKLYVKGKKFHDYSVEKPTLSNGRFVNKYCVDEEEYRKMKELDMKRAEDEEEQTPKMTAKQRTELMSETIGKMIPFLKEKCGVTQKELAKVIGVSTSTVEMWFREYKKRIGVFEKQMAVNGLGFRVHEKGAPVEQASIPDPLKSTTNLTDTGEGVCDDTPVGRDIDDGDENDNQENSGESSTTLIENDNQENDNQENSGESSTTLIENDNQENSGESSTTLIENDDQENSGESSTTLIENDDQENSGESSTTLIENDDVDKPKLLPEGTRKDLNNGVTIYNYEKK